MKYSSIDLSAISIALISGASLFFYSPAFLVVFAIAAFSTTGSVKLSKNFRHLIWTVVIFSLLASTSSFYAAAQQHIPFIFLWTAVSIVFCTVFSRTGFDTICRSILLFYLLFFCFELNLIWVFLYTPASDPIALVQSLNSPVMIVPNDFAYFTVVIPLLFMASRHLLHGAAVRLFLTASITLFLIVCLILQSRLAMIGVATIMCLEITATLKKKPRAWLMIAGISLTLFLFALALQKGAYSLETRLTLWVAAVFGIIESPWVGHGFGAFGNYYELFKSTGFESSLSALIVDQRYIPWPHNIFLELVFTFGLSGILPIAIFLKYVVDHLKRGIRSGGTVTQLLLVIGPMALLEMSLLRLQTIPIFLIIWISLIYDHSHNRNTVIEHESA